MKIQVGQSEQVVSECERLIAVDGSVFMAAKDSFDFVADFMEMLAEKEAEVAALISFTRDAMMRGIDFDKVESLNEKARDIFDLDDNLEEVYRSPAIQLVPTMVQLF
jgi:hypothetical protein